MKSAKKANREMVKEVLDKLTEFAERLQSEGHGMALELAYQTGKLRATLPESKGTKRGVIA